MKITAENCHKLTPEAQIELLDKIIKGAKEFDKRDEDNGAVTFVLFHVLDNLDEYAEDQFGTEGWGKGLLGDD
jgi:hypothetical protein